MQIVTNESKKELKKHGDSYFPMLVCFEKLSRYESGSFLWHWHPEIELTLITEGEMIYHVNQSVFHLHEGDILFGNANVLHAGYMYENRDCQYVSITVDPKLIYGFQNSVLFKKYVEPVVQDFSLTAVYFDASVKGHKEMTEGIRRIIQADENREFGYELEITAELQNIWRVLCLNSISSRESSPREQGEFQRIRSVMDYIEENYMKKITLDDIAEEIHLCRSECCRFFKRYMKVSLFSYLQEYRIERSLEYLDDPSCSITDAAVNVGFSDSNYFSKVFLKVKGCSPRAYRKNLRQ
jgi:AraC-like DNA-binding protein/quercetin dioxygenase-like cupin family protein